MTAEPVPTVYRHDACGNETVMPADVVATYLLDPYAYAAGTTQCATCGEVSDSTCT